MKKSELKQLIRESIQELNERRYYEMDPYRKDADAILKRKYSKFVDSLGAVAAYDNSDKIGYFPYVGGGRSISIVDIFNSLFDVDDNKSVFKTKEEAFKAAKKVADDWEMFLNKYNIKD